ncbi:MAG: oligosaccharide flippase family protein [Arcticibacter sp.]
MKIIKTLKKSSLLKSGFAVTAGRGSLIVANFLIFYILVRICSPADFGTWVLYSSIITIFDVANSSFISNAIIKYYHDYTGESTGRFVYNAVLFSVFLTFLISIILYLSIYVFDGIYKSGALTRLLWLGPLLLLPSGFINVINSIEQGNSRFYGQLVASVIRSGLFILYLLFLFITKHEFSIRSFVLVNIVAAGVALVVVFFMTRRYLKFTLTFDRLIVKNIAKYGFFTFGIEVTGQVSNNIGQLISGALLSPASVGVINVASRILQFIEIPLQAISTLLMPKGVATLKERGMAGIKDLYEKSSALVVLTMLPVLLLFFIFADEIIRLIAGNQFGQAAVLLRIILVYSLLKPFGRNAGVILNAIGKARINFLMILIPTAINLILNYFLIKQMGVIGSPIATFISVFVGFVFNQYVLYRIAGVEFKSILSQIANYSRIALVLLVPKLSKV